MSLNIDIDLSQDILYLLGKKEGRRIGREIGRRIGREIGRKIAKEKQRAIAKKEKVECIKRLLSLNVVLTDDQIAKIFSVEVTFVREVRKESTK